LRSELKKDFEAGLGIGAWAYSHLHFNSTCNAQETGGKTAAKKLAREKQGGFGPPDQHTGPPEQPLIAVAALLGSFSPPLRCELQLPIRKKNRKPHLMITATDFMEVCLCPLLPSSHPLLSLTIIPSPISQGQLCFRRAGPLSLMFCWMTRRPSYRHVCCCQSCVARSVPSDRHACIPSSRARLPLFFHIGVSLPFSLFVLGIPMGSRLSRCSRRCSRVLARFPALSFLHRTPRQWASKCNEPWTTAAG